MKNDQLIVIKQIGLGTRYRTILLMVPCEHSTGVLKLNQRLIKEGIENISRFLD